MQKIDFLNIYEAPKVQAKLDGRIMFSGEKNEIIHLSLKSGEKIDLHDNPVNVVFYIIDGNGIFVTPDKEVNVKKDMRIYVATGEPRGLRNNSQTPLEVLVIKGV